MLTLKTSVGAAILAGAAAASAGAAYLVTKATVQASVTMSCPAPSALPPVQSRSFPPLGKVPSTFGGKQW